ncbi:hypothetical protein AMJ74_05160, partial [candidate division WOR_3 bacterium SM1_77]
MSTTQLLSCIICILCIFSLSSAQVDTVWVRTYNGPWNGGDHAYAVGFHRSGGNVYVTGKSAGINNPDMLTIMYDSEGVEQWVARYAGPNDLVDYAEALAVDDSSNVY